MKNEQQVLLAEKYKAEYLGVCAELARRRKQSLRDYLQNKKGLLGLVQHFVAVFRMSRQFSRKNGVRAIGAAEAGQIHDEAMRLIDAEIQRGTI